MTKERCKSLISNMGNITEIRYIILTKKSLNVCNPSKLTNYSMVNYNFLVDSNWDMKSKHVTCNCSKELAMLGRQILISLIMNPPDSLLGISIVADAPECNKAMLNVRRPGVLRQYYGRNIEDINNTLVRRVAYHSQISIKSEGSDPNKLIIKPFSSEMMYMAEYLRNFIVINVEKLDLQDVDLCHDFNTCSVLLYHAINNIKKESSMGWHCDSKHSLSGNFSKLTNGQLINTPVVIFTIGQGRLLKWRRRFTKWKDNGRKSWQVDKSTMHHMLLKHGDICILNPKDEKPHIDHLSQEEVHYQHGNTKVTKDDISIAFVFRVSPHVALCRKDNNSVVLPDNMLEGIQIEEEFSKVTQADRIAQYEGFDKDEYHSLMKKHFKSILGI